MSSYQQQRTMKDKRVNRLSFVNKLKQQPIYREKFLHTVWLCWAFIMLGLVEALFGPTFPDLRLIINETLDTSSWLFTSTSAGFLLGSAVIGFLYDRYNRLLVLIFAIVGMSVTQVAVPYCPYFWLMMAVKFVSGIMAAGLDTGGNAEVVGMWRSQSGSYMQALHFCFSLGGVIAPFIAEPFLAEKILNPLQSAGNDSFANGTSMFKSPINCSSMAKNGASINTSGSLCMNGTVNNNVSGITIEIFGETSVQYAYVISALLVFVTVIPFACLYYIKRYETQKRNTLNEQQKKSTNFHSRPLAVKVLLLVLITLLMCIYCGTEDTYAGFLMTFVISELNWSKSKGSVATSVYWICFGVARLLCIPLIRYVKTSTLMLIFSSLLVVSFTGLLLATIYKINALIWIFIGAPGLAMSLIFPAVFTWTNDNLVNVSGKISSLLMVSASVGIMVFPLLFGYTMDHISPIWFIYLLIGQSVVWVLLFVVTIVATSCLLTASDQKLETEAAMEEGHLADAKRKQFADKKQSHFVDTIPVNTQRWINVGSTLDFGRDVNDQNPTSIQRLFGDVETTFQPDVVQTLDYGQFYNQIDNKVVLDSFYVS